MISASRIPTANGNRHPLTCGERRYDPIRIDELRQSAQMLKFVSARSFIVESPEIVINPSPQTKVPFNLSKVCCSRNCRMLDIECSTHEQYCFVAVNRREPDIWVSAPEAWIAKALGAVAVFACSSEAATVGIVLGMTADARLGCRDSATRARLVTSMAGHGAMGPCQLELGITRVVEYPPAPTVWSMTARAFVSDAPLMMSIGMTARA